MDPNPLVKEQIDAGNELASELNKTFPVQAAFWLKPAETGRWYLYLASNRVGDRGVGDGYREVVRLARERPNPYLDPFRVKLIPITDPRAREALEFYKLYPTRTFERYGEGSFGGEAIEGLYITRF